MKTYCVWVVCLFLLIGCGKSETEKTITTGKTGKVSMDTAYFKKMSREELISKAEEILYEDEECGYKKGLCEDIRIFATDRTVFVTFSVPLRYVPLNSGAYYGVMVDLVGDLISYDSMRNPVDFKGDLKFYSGSVNDKEAIAFVLKSLKVDPNFSEVSSGKIPRGLTLTIVERDDHYAVTAVTSSVEFGAEVYKETAEVNGFYSASIMPPPGEGDPAVEIKKDSE